LPVGLALRRAYAAAGVGPPLEQLGVPIARVPTLNGEEAREALRDTDVAVSLDNSLISEETFTVPRLGTINVHHGSVPDYRGGPPVFWELADGQERVGFTVHRIDAGIDTGPVLAAGDVPIEYRPTLAATLGATIPRLHGASLEALEDVLLGGDFDGRPQPQGVRARTTPTLGDYLNVRRALRDYHRSP
jgi:methionyl-tRNA formyltransferase